MASSDLPTPRDPGIAFSYNGHAICFDADRLINLTQMWESEGRPNNRDPSQWKKTQQGASFIASLCKSEKVRFTHVFRSMRGRGNKGVWAHWQIALAYAKYLSHEYHRYVNEAFREWAEEKANPDLKVERAVEGYRSRGWSDGRIQARLEGIVARRIFTDTLLGHGVHREGYATCTDAINDPILGCTAKEAKIARNLPARARLRDHLDPLKLTALRFAEMMAEKKIEDGAAHGNEECRKHCDQAGRAVRDAMASMGLAG